VPDAAASNPEPVTVTTLPPFTQVPGVAVRVGGAPVEVVDWALQGAVVVVVAPAVVVVVVVPPPPPKLMSPVASAPAESPNERVQVSPAVTWAVVGGQG
jgi:hypothetical protein